MIAVGVWVDAGSRYEELRMSGATHILHRISLRGTENLSEAEIAKRIDALDGDVKHQTGRDFGAWLASVKSKDLESSLDLLAELTLRPLVTKEALAAEQTVLLEELCADEEDPDFNLERMFLRSLWKTHGLCRPPRGRVLTVRDSTRLEDFKPKVLERFHSETHHPKALTVVLSGDLDHEKALASVQAVFGELEPPKKTAGTTPPTPFRFMALRTRAEFPGVRMQLGVPACGAADGHRHVAQLLNAVLGRGKDSRLARLLRSKSLPVEEGYTTLDMFADAGLLSVRLRTSPEHAGKALEVAVDELRKLTMTPVDEKELADAQAQIESTKLAATESLETRVESLAETERYFREVVDAKDELAKIGAVTPEELRGAASEWIVPHSLSLAVLGDLKGADINPSTLRW